MPWICVACGESKTLTGVQVICGSTDYRDVRKAAYQEYAIASQHTVCRLPGHIPPAHGAALGVAYVAASLSLGVCLGVRLPDMDGTSGPDIRRLVRRTALEDLPADTVAECLSMPEHERPRAGEWLVVWGGSSTTALLLSQMARLAGLRVILVVDVAKHGARLLEAPDCVLVDSHDAGRASEVIRHLTAGQLRFAVDTVGKPSTDALGRLLASLGPDPQRRAHVVGLAALPKERRDRVVYHSVPVKLFHEVAAVGRALTAWLEHALQHRVLRLPVVELAAGGLDGVNAALDRMRRGHISGKRLVVPL